MVFCSNRFFFERARNCGVKISVNKRNVSNAFKSFKMLRLFKTFFLVGGLIMILF